MRSLFVYMSAMTPSLTDLSGSQRAMKATWPSAKQSLLPHQSQLSSNGFPGDGPGEPQQRLGGGAYLLRRCSKGHSGQSVMVSWLTCKQKTKKLPSWPSVSRLGQSVMVSWLTCKQKGSSLRCLQMAIAMSVMDQMV